MRRCKYIDRAHVAFVCYGNWGEDDNPFVRKMSI